MREKFYCQSAGPNNGINQGVLVRDNYKNTSSQPEYISINTTLDEYHEGDIWLVETTLLSRTGSNGRERNNK